MYSLSQLSRRYLRRQWKRTIFTTLGIIMATALFAGLALLFTSFVNMYVSSEEAGSGEWHYQISGLSVEQARQLQGNIRLKDSELIASSAWMGRLQQPETNVNVDTNADTNADTNQWLLLRDISELGNKMTPHAKSLMSGRLPQNSSEIALNTSALNFFPDLELNQEIELELVNKSTGGELQTGDESQTITKKYTVTGITDWVSSQLPQPVYYALTYLDEADKNLAEVYFTVKASSDFEANALAALNDVLPDYEWGKTENQQFSNTEIGSAETIKFPDFKNNSESVWQDINLVRMQTHDNLLRFMGQSSYDGTNQDLLTFFAVLATIIMVSVIFVIRNSFAMSVSERTSEYGLLRVVGGSPAQIRRLVMQDAAQMAIIGVPIGLLAGIAAMKITLDYVSGLGIPEIEYLKLIVSPWPLVIAAALSLLAIILAAIAPAVQAGKLAPMEAVRRSAVYTVKGKSDRSLRRKGLISRKIIGVTGFLAGRSIRRDRKRFRVTALSIMVSAVLFLAAGGISIMFSRQLVSFNTEQSDFTMNAYADTPGATNAELSQIAKIAAENPALARIAKFGQFSLPMDISPDMYNEDLIEAIQKMYTIGGQPSTREQALETLAGQDATVRIMLADRDLLDELEISNADQVWQKMQQGQAIISQKFPVSIADLSFQTVSYTNLGAGDTISVGDIETYITPSDNAIEASKVEQQLVKIPGLPDSYKIAAEIDQLPWFSEGFFSGWSSVILIVDREYITNHIAASPELQEHLEILELVAIDAIDGRETEFDQLIEPYKSDASSYGNGTDIGLQNNFERMQISRGLIKTINVFVYGFTTVIVLICTMNILNTVTTNVLLRRRELAMLQAVGMSRSQVRKMLLMECSLYGINGAFWGTIIGTALLYLLGASINGTMGNMSLSAIPWNLVIATIVGALIISITAGILPIRRVMRDEVVESIRGQE
jgi:putative ABC transport system permease protein